MRRSDILKFITNSMKFWSHFETGTKYLGRFLGRGSEDEGPTTEIKGWSGVFGSADERGFQVTLRALERTKAYKGTAFLVSEFLDWEFPTKTHGQSAASYLGRNMFTTFVHKMGHGEGTKIGTSHTVRNFTTSSNRKTVSGDIKTTITDNREVFSRGVNNSLEFLQLMVDMILNGKKVSELEPEEKIAGFEKFEKFCVATGVPTYSKTLGESIIPTMIHSAPAAVIAAENTLSTATDRLHDLADRLKSRRQNRLRNLISKTRRTRSDARV